MGSPSGAAKPTPTVDASDRKFYVKAADNGNKQALEQFDDALAAQSKPEPPKPATPPSPGPAPKPHVEPQRAEDPSDQKFYNMAADRQNKVIDLENEARSLQRDIDALGTAGGYATTAMQAELDEVEDELRALRGLPRQADDAPIFTAPPITPEQALATIRDNAETFDQAAGRGGDDAVIGIGDLEAVADPENGFDSDLRAAAQYLLDNPRFFDRVEVANDGGGFHKNITGDARRDDKFSVEDINRFLEQNEHLEVIYANVDALDIANAGHGADENISRDDLQAVLNAEDESGRPVYSAELRDAARYLLDNDAFFRELETSNGRRNIGPDGDLTFGDLNAAILDRQVLASDPAAARAFIVNGDAHLPGTNISDNGSIPSEGLRALAGAALSETSSLSDAVDLITQLPETNDGVRNDLITATYAEIATRYDGFLGDDSGANWSHWGVWASAAVGDVIRGDATVPLVIEHRPDGAQRTNIAEGNLLLYEELAPHLADFYQEFGNDAYADKDRLDSFLQRFGPDQEDFAQAFSAYYEARFETDPHRKQELALVGNYHLVQHEQTLVDGPLDKILTDLPIHADIFNKVSGNLGSDRAFEAIRVSYPGRETSVVFDVPPHGAFPTAYENHLVDLDAIQDSRIIDTIEGFRETGGRGSPSADSLEHTYADDWHEYDERLYYIVQDWRLHHTDAGLLAVDDRGFDSINWLS